MKRNSRYTAGDLCLNSDRSEYEMQINVVFCCELTVGLFSDLYSVQLNVQCFVIKKRSDIFTDNSLW